MNNFLYRKLVRKTNAHRSQNWPKTPGVLISNYSLLVLLLKRWDSCINISWSPCALSLFEKYSDNWPWNYIIQSSYSWPKILLTCSFKQSKSLIRLRPENSYKFSYKVSPEFQISKWDKKRCKFLVSLRRETKGGEYKKICTHVIFFYISRSLDELKCGYKNVI